MSDDGYKRLAVSVIELAINDYRRLHQGRELLKWMKGPDGAFWCDVADMDQLYLVEAIQRAGEGRDERK